MAGCGRTSLVNIDSCLRPQLEARQPAGSGEGFTATIQTHPKKIFCYICKRFANRRGYNAEARYNDAIFRCFRFSDRDFLIKETSIYLTKPATSPPESSTTLCLHIYSYDLRRPRIALNIKRPASFDVIMSRLKPNAIRMHITHCKEKTKEGSIIESRKVVEAMQLARTV